MKKIIMLFGVIIALSSFSVSAEGFDDAITGYIKSLITYRTEGLAFFKHEDGKVEYIHLDEHCMDMDASAPLEIACKELEEERSRGYGQKYEFRAFAEYLIKVYGTGKGVTETQVKELLLREVVKINNVITLSKKQFGVVKFVDGHYVLVGREDMSSCCKNH